MPADRKLSSGSPEILHSTCDGKRIAAALRAKGLPVELSKDAGGYLCNAVFYHSLAAAEREGRPCIIAFIHIPADLSRPPFDRERAQSGALEIVKLVAESAREDAKLTSV